MFVKILVLVLLTGISVEGISQSQRDYVPDSVTAIKVAEAVLVSFYGEEIVNDLKPLTATLKDGKVWKIKSGRERQEHEIGGQLYVEINKSDCKILKAYIRK